MEAKKNPDKDINRKSGQFFLIGLSISISIMIIAFEWETEKIILPSSTASTDGPEILAEIPIIKIESPRPVQEPIAKPKQSSTSFIPVEADPASTPSTSNDPKIIDSDSIVFSGNPIIETDIPEEDTTIFITAQEPPTPVVGYESFYQQLARFIKYPAQARRTSTEGKVFVEFVVSKKGEPTDLKVIKGIGAGCDEEAIRALASMKWNPGKQRGKSVRVKMVIPVYFRLN